MIPEVHRYLIRIKADKRNLKLTFDLLTMKVVSKSRVTWATSVPILVFLIGISSRLRPDVRDKQTDRRQTKASLNASAL